MLLSLCRGSEDIGQPEWTGAVAAASMLQHPDDILPNVVRYRL